jgi:hypothetical protein
MKTGHHLLCALTAALVVVLAVTLIACSSKSPPTTSSTGTQPVAVKLVFTTQPVGATAGSPFATQPVVAAVDINGNVVAGPRKMVTLSITGITADSHISLFGGTTVMSVNGVFNFKEISIDRAGTYTLTATSNGLTSAVSSPFDITPIEGARLVFSKEIVGASAGLAFAAQPVVTVLDMYGNTVPGSTAEVSLGLVPITPESYEGILSGVTKIKAVNGAANFTGLSIDKVGTYTLMATSGGLTPVYSNSFDITPGTGVKLFFNTQPLTAAVQDDYGNTATSSSAEITLTITPNTGANGAALSGVTKLKAINGIASFEGLSIDKVGTGYKLTATSSGLKSGVSDPFDITPPAPVPTSSNATTP